MTIKQHITEKVNEYIARQIWAKISTELDHLMMQQGKLHDEVERFAWMRKRANELVKEFANEKETKNKMGNRGGDEA